MKVEGLPTKPPTQNKVFQSTRLSPRPTPRTTKISDEHKLQDSKLQFAKVWSSPDISLKCYQLPSSPLLHTRTLFEFLICLPSGSSSRT